MTPRSCLPSGIVVLAGVWTLTASDPFVHGFRDGKRIAGFGRSGDGPGEMRSPLTLLFGAQTVWDAGSARILTFSSTGSTVSARAAVFGAGSIRDNIEAVTFGDPFRVVSGLEQTLAVSYRGRVSLGRDLWNGRLLKYRGEENGEPLIDFLELRGASQRVDAVLGPVPLWDGCPDGRIAVLDPIARTLHLIRSEWEQRDSIALPWEARPLRQAERVGYIVAQYRVEAGVPTISQEEIEAIATDFERENRGEFATEAPLGVDLKCAPGRAWVQEFDGRTHPLGYGPVWRTISLTGTPPASVRVTLPVDFTPYRISDSRILGVLADSVGLQQIATIALPPVLRSH